MSTTSMKPLTTLKGVFDVPKMNHRRDFLRENKLSLRELQRVTCKKQTTQQQQQQQKLHRQEQSHQQQQEYYTSKRRSASQQRAPCVTGATTQTMTGQPAKEAFKRSLSQQRAGAHAQHGYVRSDSQPRNGYVRSDSQPRNGFVRSDSQPRNGLTSQTQPASVSSRCPSCSGRDASIGRNGSLAALSRAESQDKQIQTEDIQDEIFLYDALKKCASQELSSVHTHQSVAKAQSHSEPNMLNSNRYQPNKYEEDLVYNQNNHESAQLPLNVDMNTGDMSPHTHNYPQDDLISHHALPQGSYRHVDNVSHQLSQKQIQQQQQQPSYRQESHFNKDNQITTPRSHILHNMNGHLEEEQQQAERQAAIEDEVRSNFDNLTLHSKYSAQENLSARSRHTNCTTQSNELTKKKSNTSLHKLGGREDVRLPRYLEREKREKEEIRVREMERDPHCPMGHIALPEQERVTALTAAEKKFQTLINELNHMPMTMETLRIRKRKNEIEKELTTLEADIRIFSKPKVYVRQDD